LAPEELKYYSGNYILASSFVSVSERRRGHKINHLKR